MVYKFPHKRSFGKKFNHFNASKHDRKIMKASSIIKPVQDKKTRVSMLREMFEQVKGTDVLLEELQPDPKNYNFDSADIRKKHAFKTLIATMLSVRSKDETTLKVVNNLWTHYDTPEKLMNAPLEHVETLIHSSGTYRQKAKRIIEAARVIHEEYNDIVPPSQEKLMKIKGVGRKVANCVLVVSFNIPVIPVDTHVHRISNRTGWVTTKTPDKTEFALEQAFPKSEWLVINYALVSFGKTICKPIGPLCEMCSVNDRCMKRIIVAPKKKKKTPL